MPGRLCKHRLGSYSQSRLGGAACLHSAFREGTSGYSLPPIPGHFSRLLTKSSLGITFSSSFRGTERFFFSLSISVRFFALSSAYRPARISNRRK